MRALLAASIVAALASPRAAHADDPGALDPTAGARPGAGDPIDGAPGADVTRDPPFRVNVRVGGASTDRNGMPTVCVEAHLWRGVGVETCGTGAQVWHEDGGAEMAHFRTHAELLRFATPGAGRLGLRAGFGFAELSVAPDQLGFQFGDPDATRASAAGPEAALSGQWTRPVAGDVDAIATFTIGAAYLQGAPALVLPRSELQPFASFEVGIGW